MSGYFSVGFEVAAEVTYPELESNSSSLLNGGAQILGLLMTFVLGQLIQGYGDFVANFVAFALLVVACVVGYLTPSVKRRQNALTKNNSYVLTNQENKELENV